MFRLMCSYTFKTLFRKRFFTFASITAIVLFIVSIVSVFIVGMSVWQSYKDYLNKLYGSYTGVVRVENADMLDEIEESPEVNHSSTILVYATLNIPQEALNDMFSVAYMENEALSLANITLLKGRLPKKAGEVIIEESVLQKLNGARLNEVYSFEMESGGEIISVNYKIVGTVSDYSAFQLMRHETVSVWPSVITTFKDETLEPKEVFSVISVKNNSTRFLENLSERYTSPVFISPQFSEQSFTSIVGGSTRAILIISVFAVIIIALISLGSFVSLSANVVEEQIQSLKFLGASSLSMLLFGVLNLLMLYLIALPVGFVGGIACGYGLSSYIVDGFIDFYRYDISILSVVSGVFITLAFLLLIRIIKILRIKDKKPLDCKELEKFCIKKCKSSKHGSVFLKWSIASLIKNKRIYFGVALSMSVCYFVLFMGGMYTQTIKNEYEIDFSDHYSIRHIDGEFFASLHIPSNPFSGIIQSDVDNILSNSEVDTFSYIKNFPVILDINNDSETDKGMNLQSVRETSGLNDEEYEAELEEYGIEPSGELYNAPLNICDDGFISKLLHGENTKGAASLEEFNENNDVIVVCRGNADTTFNIGDSVSVIQVIAKDGYRTPSKERRLLELSLKVSAIVKLEETDYMYDKFRGSSIAFVCSDTALQNAGINLSYNHLYFNLKDPSVYSDTQSSINHLKQLYPEISIVSERENESEKHQLLHALNLIVVVLSVFIFVVCLFNIINILSMKYINDKKLWGTLKAMGISRFRVILHHFGEMLAVMLVSVLLNAVFLEIASQRIRQDIIVFNPFVLSGYFICSLLICLFTLPIVLFMFRQNIIKQIEYLG
ncbi:MAG TPA: FtsX-like permease family protein [Oscillospiraceae bacterium]|nr:FtsX-like permease family protein [Oscillospiraceae bacterium]